MNSVTLDQVAVFRNMHQRDRPLLLPNAWDAGSARIFEAAGAAAIATTSGGLSWAHGYSDGSMMPVETLVGAVAEIRRVVSVPLSVDVEAGYGNAPSDVSALVAALVERGATGINIEDGEAAADLLCAKIKAVKQGVAALGADVFINARTDVYLRGLVPPEQALAETVDRAGRYRAAGCDGLFVPGLIDADAIRDLAAAIAMPLNVMVVPGLPSVAELASLGVSRISAGTTIAQASFGEARRTASQFVLDGSYDGISKTTIDYGELNALFPPNDLGSASEK